VMQFPALVRKRETKKGGGYKGEGENCGNRRLFISVDKILKKRRGPGGDGREGSRGGKTINNRQLSRRARGESEKANKLG